MILVGLLPKGMSRWDLVATAAANTSCPWPSAYKWRRSGIGSHGLRPVLSRIECRGGARWKSLGNGARPVELWTGERGSLLRRHWPPIIDRLREISRLRLLLDWAVLVCIGLGRIAILLDGV